MSVRYRLAPTSITLVARNQWGNAQGDADSTILPVEPDPIVNRGWCSTPASVQAGFVSLGMNLLLTTLAVVAPLPIGDQQTASAPYRNWQPANTSQSSPVSLLTSVSTTVLRTPTYQQAKSAPAVNVVQFPNLLTSTLSAAVPPFIPAAQPSLARSIQVLLDTSKGTPKTLTADAQLPVQNVQIAAPGAVRLVVNTSYGQPLTLQVIAPPFFNPPYASPIRVLWQPLEGSSGTPKTLTADAQLPFQNPAMSVLGRSWTLADTSQSTPRTLDVLSAPVGQASYVKLPASSWQPLDTSKGTPKTLTADAQLPVQNVQIAAPGAVRLVVDTSRSQPITLQVIVPPPPFTNLAQSITPWSSWQPIDTSHGTAKPLIPDAQLPVQNVQIAAPAAQWQPIDTSHGQPITLQVIAPPPPFFNVVQSTTPRTTWQPADTSRGTTKTLIPDAQLPFLNIQLTAPSRIWGIVNTSQGTPVELFPIVVPGGAEYSFTFIGV